MKVPLGVITLACSLIASCISSWHQNGHIIPAFIIYHVQTLHLHNVAAYLAMGRRGEKQRCVFQKGECTGVVYTWGRY